MLALLFPTRCPLCARAVAGPNGCCRWCWKELLRPEATERTLWLGNYDGPLGHAVQRVKYHDAGRLATALGGALADAVAERRWRIGHVTHVPLHRSRARARGYDQAARIARAAAARLEVPWRPVLDRVRMTASQVDLGRRQRARNVRGAFAAQGPVRASVLLIDDVLTSGATTEACAAALARAGCPRVYVGVIARASLRDSPSHR